MGGNSIGEKLMKNNTTAYIFHPKTDTPYEIATMLTSLKASNFEAWATMRCTSKDYKAVFGSSWRNKELLIHFKSKPVFFGKITELVKTEKPKGVFICQIEASSRRPIGVM